MKRIVGATVGIALAGLAATAALLTAHGSGVSPLDRTDASIVFVCQNGVAMSVWSALRFNELAQERGLWVRASARAAAQTFTTVPVRMKLALSYDGFAIGGYLPKVVGTEDVRHADRVVVASRAELEKRVDELVARLATDRGAPAVSRAARGVP